MDRFSTPEKSPGAHKEGLHLAEDLSVELAGIKLRNPVILASGTAGYGTELAPVIDLSRLGGIILKSVTAEPRKGNPEPRIWETSSGMLNSIGLENVGIDALVAEVLPRLKDAGLPVFASVAGDTVRAFARLGAKLEGAEGLSGIEINVSCPNVERGGIQFGVDPGATKAVVMAVRENCSLPLFVKLSAAVQELARIADAAGQAGAFGLSQHDTGAGYRSGAQEAEAGRGDWRALRAGHQAHSAQGGMGLLPGYRPSYNRRRRNLRF
jgi:dihydroorotate dehydrogenase (NAD+) catalytic subunit